MKIPCKGGSGVVKDGTDMTSVLDFIVLLQTLGTTLNLFVHLGTSLRSVDRKLSQITLLTSIKSFLGRGLKFNRIDICSGMAFLHWESISRNFKVPSHDIQ